MPKPKLSLIPSQIPSLSLSLIPVRDIRGTVIKAESVVKVKVASDDGNDMGSVEARPDDQTCIAH